MITHAKDLPDHKMNKQEKEFDWLERTYPDFLKRLDFLLKRAKSYPTTFRFHNFNTALRKPGTLSANTEGNLLYVTDRFRSRRILKEYMCAKGYDITIERFNGYNYMAENEMKVRIR